MIRILFATGNSGKMKEIREILSEECFQVVSLKEAGIVCDAEENGDSFAANALIKARNVAGKVPLEEGWTVMADDSGLEVDALGGEPGIHSARYMGEDTPYTIKNAEIIRRLENVSGDARSARFRCVIAAVLPDGQELLSEGAIEGRIGYEARGENGFGYDPIFYPDGSERSTAEYSPEEKNAVSHRGRALSEMKTQLLKKTSGKEKS